MSINTEYSRISLHGISGVGATFSVPSQEDFTDPGSAAVIPWSSNGTQLLNKEIGVNTTDNKIFIRVGSTINEFLTTDRSGLFASYSISGTVTQDISIPTTIKLNLTGNTDYSYTNATLGPYKFIVEAGSYTFNLGFLSEYKVLSSDNEIGSTGSGVTGSFTLDGVYDGDYMWISRLSTYIPMPVAWNPLEISNLADWWDAGNGVNYTGLNVTSWTGYNGGVLTSGAFGGPAAVYGFSASDSALNSNPSILFNSANTGTDQGMRSIGTYSATGKTAIIIGKMFNSSGDDAVINLWSNRFANSPPTAADGSHATIFAGLAPYGTYPDPSASYSLTKFAAFYTNSGGGNGISTGTASSNLTFANDFFFSMIEVDSSVGSPATANFYVTDTSTLGPLFSTKNNIQFSNTLGQDYNSIVVGGYNQLYGGTPKMNVAEVIWVSGILSAGDKTLLQAYVSTKYAV